MASDSSAGGSGPAAPGALDEGARRRLIEEHLAAIRDLQRTEEPNEEWPPSGYYLVWHALIGAALGALGAAVSLGANVLGAPLVGRRPLDLIRVYLTFPMGERALEADQAMVLFVGCLLYLVTGAIYGVIVHLVLSLRFAEVSRMRRFLVATALGLGLWIFNFYLVLSWLQPALLGGDWIVSSIPAWVGAATHLAFVWTLLLGESWAGRFEPYGRGVETAHA